MRRFSCECYILWFVTPCTAHKSGDVFMEWCLDTEVSQLLTFQTLHLCISWRAALRRGRPTCRRLLLPPVGSTAHALQTKIEQRCKQKERKLQLTMLEELAAVLGRSSWHFCSPHTAQRFGATAHHFRRCRF